jgi:hypothetical protein
MPSHSRPRDYPVYVDMGGIITFRAYDYDTVHNHSGGRRNGKKTTTTNLREKDPFTSFVKSPTSSPERNHHWPEYRGWRYWWDHHIIKWFSSSSNRAKRRRFKRWALGLWHWRSNAWWCYIRLLRYNTMLEYFCRPEPGNHSCWHVLVRCCSLLPWSPLLCIGWHPPGFFTLHSTVRSHSSLTYAHWTPL